jgi:Flp pilus assembly protein TadG
MVITLPIFLMIMFAVMEFGNLFLSKNQVNSVAQAVANYLESKPSATNNELAEFAKNLGLGILKNTGPGEDNEISQKLKIKSSKTMFTATQFDGLCSGAAIKDWSNPWADDPVPGNRTNPYYIHVCFNYTYPSLTPLANLIGTVADKILNGRALAYISKGDPNNNQTCAAGNVPFWTGQYSVCNGSYGQLTEGNSQNITYLQYQNSCPSWNGYYTGSLTVTCTNGQIVQSNPVCTWVEQGCDVDPDPDPNPDPNPHEGCGIVDGANRIHSATWSIPCTSPKTGEITKQCLDGSVSQVSSTCVDPFCICQRCWNITTEGIPGYTTLCPTVDKGPQPTQSSCTSACNADPMFTDLKKNSYSGGEQRDVLQCYWGGYQNGTVASCLQYKY